MRKIITLLGSVLLICSLLTTAFAGHIDSYDAPGRTAFAGSSKKLDSKVEAMLKWALATAADDSHGYSQSSRYGPNYDCTSFVSTALMKGGFELEGYLNTHTLVSELPKLGFTCYRRGEVEPQRGDILVQVGVHAEISMGNGECVAAHMDYDGCSGDRSGHEIEYRDAHNYLGCPFCSEKRYDYVLRYKTPKKSTQDSEESAQDSKQSTQETKKSTQQSKKSTQETKQSNESTKQTTQTSKQSGQTTKQKQTTKQDTKKTQSVQNAKKAESTKLEILRDRLKAEPALPVIVNPVEAPNLQDAVTLIG